MSFVNRFSKSNIQVVEAPDLIRLGGENDGGYVVSREAIRNASLLLSFGVSKDWKFEREVQKIRPGITIWAYDHTVGPKTFLNIAFFAWATSLLRLLCLNRREARKHVKRWLTAIDYFIFFNGPVRHIQKRVWYNTDRGSASISDIIASASHYPKHSLFAKIDIEGSEYRILPEIADHAELFSGLVVEFHDIDITGALFNEIISGLSKEFYLVHIHGNNYVDLSINHDFPNAVEITWTHKRLFTTAPKPFTGSFPRKGLDAPNNPDAEEIEINL
jgi:hypothetical protein